MKNNLTQHSAEIQILTDVEIEAVAGAAHNQIRLPNLGMIIDSNDEGYAVSMTQGGRTEIHGHRV